MYHLKACPCAMKKKPTIMPVAIRMVMMDNQSRRDHHLPMLQWWGSVPCREGPEQGDRRTYAVKRNETPTRMAATLLAVMSKPQKMSAAPIRDCRARQLAV